MKAEETRDFLGSAHARPDQELPPLSLYLHYPWCLAKCPYCDFNSHQVKESDDRQAYLRQLREDLRQSAALAQDRKLESLYIGGGTPSLMQPSEVVALLEEIDRQFGVPDEITLESNPGTFEAEKFEGFRSAGVTRLSIGVQSFQDDKLVALGRVHDANEALHAATNALQIFERVNIDLMYGLPGQSIADALFDLERAIGTGVEHISWYQLTIEPRTVFYRRPPVLPKETATLSIEEAGLEALKQAGFERYEISAFARRGESCIHNLNYWRFGDYLGVGAGAHGKLTTSSGPIRTEFARQPRLYLAGRDDRHRVSPIAQESLPVEFMMNALRLIEGVEESLFEARTGIEFSRIAERVEQLRNLGFLQPSRLGLTERGLTLLDSVVAEFL